MYARSSHTQFNSHRNFVKNSNNSNKIVKLGDFEFIIHTLKTDHTEKKNERNGKQRQQRQIEIGEMNLSVAVWNVCFFLNVPSSTVRFEFWIFLNIIFVTSYSFLCYTSNTEVATTTTAAAKYCSVLSPHLIHYNDVCNVYIFIVSHENDIRFVGWITYTHTNE